LTVENEKEASAVPYKYKFFSRETVLQLLDVHALPADVEKSMESRAAILNPPPSYPLKSMAACSGDGLSHFSLAWLYVDRSPD
jgi:hypothetical protein